jgi:hypothetical protein
MKLLQTNAPFVKFVCMAHRALHTYVTFTVTYINNGIAGLYEGGNNDGGRHESS